MKKATKKKTLELVDLVGRLGAPTGLRPAGVMGDRRTKRNRTRAAQIRRAIEED
jgi:hypothetical protein